MYVVLLDEFFDIGVIVESLYGRLCGVKVVVVHLTQKREKRGGRKGRVRI